MNIEYKKRLISIVLSINILATGSLMSGCEFNNNKTTEDVPVSSSSEILDYYDLNNILSKVDGFVHIINYKEENNYYVGTFKNDNDVIYKLIDKYGNILEDDYIDVNIVNANKIISNINYDKDVILFNSDNYIYIEGNIIGSNLLDGSMIAHSYFDEYMVYNDIVLFRYQNVYSYIDKDGYIKTSECKDFNELKDFVSSSNVLSLNNN
ncbi:unknown [Clostridium sp. CAG:628]|nr:unknown [Clostridium sp. CAG:628]